MSSEVLPGALPDTMPAAVYTARGEITLEQRPVPRPGPGTGARRGRPLRHLRFGHPHHARGMGQARRGRGPRVQRGRRRRRRRRRHLVGGRRSGRRSFAPVRPLRALPRGPAVAVREPRALDVRGHAQRWGLRGLPRDRRSGPAAPARRALAARRRAGRAAGRRPARDHARRHRRRRLGDGLRRRPDRRPVDRRAREPWTRSGHGGRARCAAARAGPAARRARGARPDELELFPPFEPDRISTRAVDVVLECSGKKAAMEAGFHQLRRGGTLVLVGAGIEAPSFDPNRMLLNELVVTGSFVYDADGFERALELLASASASRPTCSSSPRT